MISPNESWGFTSNAEHERLVLTIGAAALASKLCAITGKFYGRALKFQPEQNNALQGTKALRSHAFLLADMLTKSAVPLPRPVLEEFEQTVMVMFVHANRHNYSHLLEEVPSDLAGWQIRRAEDYIEATARQAVSLENLVEVTGVSALALFRAFKRRRGFSPTDFACKVRLAQARASSLVGMKRPKRVQPGTDISGRARSCAY